MKKLLFAAFVIFWGLIAIVFAYLGAFSSLEPQRKQFGPFEGYLVPFEGKYSEAGGQMRKYRFLLRQEGIMVQEMVFLYFDNPHMNPTRAHKYAILFVPAKKADLNKNPGKPFVRARILKNTYHTVEYNFNSELAIPIIVARSQSILDPFRKKTLYQMEVYKKSYMAVMTPVTEEFTIQTR